MEPETAITQSDPSTFKEIAENAGKEIRARLVKSVQDAKQDKNYISFDPRDYNDILDNVMRRFQEEEFGSHHPGNRLEWGKGLIVIRPTTVDETTLGPISKDPWFLALATSAHQPGQALSLRGKLQLRSEDTYIAFEMVKIG